MSVPTWIVEGLDLAPEVRTPDAMDLFLYSASVWLPHRIHYDAQYATREEGHPALVVQGPLQGVYLSQLLTANFGSAPGLSRFKFRHLSPVYVEETLHCRGRIIAVNLEANTVTCELWTEQQSGRKATVAEAVLTFSEDA